MLTPTHIGLFESPTLRPWNMDINSQILRQNRDSNCSKY